MMASDTSYRCELERLVPHRGKMLLITRLVSVEDTKSSAEVEISDQAAFYVPGKGVPTWVGMEYMGQTAALIAGHQLSMGTLEAHTAFLLGTRKFSSNIEYFEDGLLLGVSCEQVAVSDSGLASFRCVIKEAATHTGKVLAESVLSVYRRRS